MNDHNEAAREKMVEPRSPRAVSATGRCSTAMRTVPREAFVPPELAEFAYEDTPLPIESRQTISQTVHRRGDDRGARSSAGANACSRSEPAPATPPPSSAASRARSTRSSATRSSPRSPRERLARPRLRNVSRPARRRLARLAGARALRRDRGRRRRAEVPRALLAQLAIGGRLVIPVGEDETSQTLVRVTRESETAVPRGGARRRSVRAAHRRAGLGARASAAPRHGRASSPGDGRRARPRGRRAHRRTSRRGSVDALLERIGDAGVVLLGEATHGTTEFYRMRARITRELIARAASTSSPSRPTGPTPRASTTTSAGSAGVDRARVHAVRALPDVDVAQRGGARASSTGCARTTRSRRPAHGSASTASTSTACSPRSPPSSTTSTTSIRDAARRARALRLR